MEIKNITHRGSLYATTEQTIVGNSYTGGVSGKIVRVLDTGSETEYKWLINNRLFDVNSGDFVIFAPSDIRMPIVKKCPSDVRIQTIDFPMSALFPGNELLELFYGQGRLYHIPADMAAAVMPSYQRALNEALIHDAYSERTCSAALRLLVIDILRLTEKEANTEDSAPTSYRHITLINDVIKYIYSNLGERITISDTAKKFNVSESLLSKVFRSMIGMTFPEYIRRLRVNYVIKLISYEGKGILDAALEAGFQSTSGFYKSFSEVTGRSPSEYIRRSQKC